MGWGDRNFGLERCKGLGGWRDKVVCGQSQHREVTICLVVFVCLSGGGVIKYHSNRSRAPLGYK